MNRIPFRIVALVLASSLIWNATAPPANAYQTGQLGLQASDRYFEEQALTLPMNRSMHFVLSKAAAAVREIQWLMSSVPAPAPRVASPLPAPTLSPETPMDREADSAKASGTNGRGQGQGKKNSIGSLVERWYFTGMSIIFIGLSVAGFLPAIIHPATRRAPITVLAAVHGIVCFAWLILYLVQSLLVALRRTAWHRKLGWVSAVLFPMMMWLSFTTAVAMVRRGFDLSGDQGIVPNPTPGTNLVDTATGAEFNFFTIPLVTVLVLTSLAFRRRPELHKKLMVFANIALVTAPLGHLTGHFPQLPEWFGAAVAISLLGSVVVRDIVVTKRMKVWAWSAILAVGMYATLPLQVLVIIPSAGYHRFIHWISPQQAIPATHKSLPQSA